MEGWPGEESRDYIGVGDVWRAVWCDAEELGPDNRKRFGSDAEALVVEVLVDADGVEIARRKSVSALRLARNWVEAHAGRAVRSSNWGRGQLLYIKLLILSPGLRSHPPL